VQDELAAGRLETLDRTMAPSPEMRIMIYSLDRRSQSPAARALKDIFRRLIHDLRSR